VFPIIEEAWMNNKIKAFIKQRFPRLVKILIKFKQIVISARRPRSLPPFQNVSSGVAVCYLTNTFPQRPPNRKGYVSGGNVKLAYLAEVFPHHFPFANILYTVSSVGHMQTPEIVASAKQKRIKIIVNQNGVAYPAWHGSGWEAANHWHNELLEQADYIVYQSHFCRVSAEHFLTPPNVPSEVIYNPVDIRLFKPISFSMKPRNLTLLLGGNQNERYRLELALQTFRIVLRENPDARLVVTGHLWKPEAEAISWTRSFLQKQNLVDKVTFTGAYSQKQAPALFNQAHVLLHTQYNDASPTLVLEAMASGLPVAYVESGGVPELVAEAGVGVPVEQSWETINLPAPEEMGKAVLEIMSRYQDFSAAARSRAVSQFSLETFIVKHRRIFEKMLEGRSQLI
jgi:glycosyltransferase involved in cell wall biosynthesis